MQCPKPPRTPVVNARKYPVSTLFHLEHEADDSRFSGMFDGYFGLPCLFPARTPRYDAHAFIPSIVYLLQDRPVLSHEHAGHGEIKRGRCVRHWRSASTEIDDERELGHCCHGLGLNI